MNLSARAEKWFCAAHALASTLLSLTSMIRKSKLALSIAILPGFAVTFGAATFGIVLLQAMTGPTCRYPKSLLERHRLEAIVEATREFAAASKRCPSGTTELVAKGHLEAATARSAWGGRFAVACRNMAEELYVQVRSPGPDSITDTTDDIVVDSDYVGSP
jgi:hypothetical protein